MVAEKTVKNFRGLLYFAAPCAHTRQLQLTISMVINADTFKMY